MKKKESKQSFKYKYKCVHQYTLNINVTLIRAQRHTSFDIITYLINYNVSVGFMIVHNSTLFLHCNK